jgi:hypothetical protein
LDEKTENAGEIHTLEGAFMKALEFDDKNSGRKWLAYFDLLGTVEASSNVEPLFSDYQDCINLAKYIADQVKNVEVAWFSDTFLLYAPDDSKKAFNSINIAARWFFDELIYNELPVRGALVCDEFYADKANSIYLGNALAQAHRWAEGFNWIGLVLAPSAAAGMSRVGQPVATMSSYKRTTAECKRGNGSYGVKSVIAYLMGPASINPVQGNNSCSSYLEIVGNMEGQVKTNDMPKHKRINRKYKRKGPERGMGWQINW